MDPGHTPDEHAEQQSGTISRKNLLKAAAVAAPLPAVLSQSAAMAQPETRSASPSASRSHPRPQLAPTPSCDDGDDPTPPQTEGPYYTPGSPQRTNLREPWMTGIPLSVSGFVFGLTCEPLADVLLDFWQCNDNGVYDNVGYTLRGHQFTSSQGAFHLETIVPGLYPGRTRHIHVKLQAPNHPILTTQLYFPGEPRNRTDPIFDPELVMNVRPGGPGKEATFDFVLRVNQSPGDPPDPPGEDRGTWEPGTTYQVGDIVTYNGQEYRCVQAHTAIVGWEPPRVPALWQPV